MCSLWNTTPSGRTWQRQFICKQIYCLSAHVKQLSLGQNKSNVATPTSQHTTSVFHTSSAHWLSLATRDSHHQYQYNINRQANPSEESSCRRNQHAPWPHHSNNTKHTHTHDMNTWVKREDNENDETMREPKMCKDKNEKNKNNATHKLKTLCLLFGPCEKGFLNTHVIADRTRGSSGTFFSLVSCKTLGSHQVRNANIMHVKANAQTTAPCLTKEMS